MSEPIFTFPEFVLHDEDFWFIGHGLKRPECVVDCGGGALASADWDGGVAIVNPSTGVQKVLANRTVHGEKLHPNGVAEDIEESFLVTHLSEEHGGLFRLHPDGRLDDVLINVDGVDLPPTNFVLRDAFGRIWVTVSTREIPRRRARTKTHADGFIVLLDHRGPRIVADQLGYTNEIRIDSSGRFLYVNETFGRKLTRFSISARGALSNRTTIRKFGHGTFPDGLTIDNEGCFWITSVYSNRLLRVFPDGSSRTVYEDSERSFLDQLEQLFESGGLVNLTTTQHKGRVLGNISSLAFISPNFDVGVLGCLDDSRLAAFRSHFWRKA